MTPSSWWTVGVSRNDIHFLGLALTLLLIFIVLSEWIRRHLLWTGEVTRKIVHIGTGVLIFFACHELQSGLPLILIGAFFTVFNFLCVRWNWFEGMHSPGRHSFGTVYYPLSFTILVILFWDNQRFIIAGSMMVLAMSDALAALVGQKMPKPHVYYLSVDKKTLEGSAAMGLSAWPVLVMTLYYFNVTVPPGVSGLWLCLLIAMVAMITEAISAKGSDNLTLPLAVAWMLMISTGTREANAELFMYGVLLSAFTAVLSYRIKFLTLSGSAGAFLLGVVIFGAGGWMWVWPMLTFFIVSSLLSHAGKKQKKAAALIAEKGETRDLGQVIANGALPGMIAIVNTFIPHPVWYAVYCGMIAAVASDTWSTEIGTLYGGTPRHLLNLKPVEAGTSGGITAIGLAGGLAGAAVIALSGYLAQPAWHTPNPGWLAILGITLAGFGGNLVDSLLGASVQSQYRCEICQKRTEKDHHCGHETLLIGGLRWFNNDRVNLLCAIAGGIIILLLSKYLFD